MLFRGDLLHGVLPALRDEIARADRKYRVTLLAGFALRACASLRHCGGIRHTTALCAAVRRRRPQALPGLRADRLTALDSVELVCANQAVLLVDSLHRSVL